MSKHPARRDALPSRLVGMLHSISYDPYVDAGWYAADNPDEMKTICERAVEYAESRVLPLCDDSLRAQESDSVGRFMCNWRRKGMFPFPYVEGDELTFRQPKQPVALRNELISLRGHLERALNRDPLGCAQAVESATYPTNKGKGSPFYIPGTARDATLTLVALIRGARCVDEVQDRCLKLGARNPLSIGLLTRIQGAKKPREEYAADAEGRPYPTGSLSLLAKVRKVQGFPFVLNFFLARLGSALLFLTRSAGVGMLPTVNEVVTATKGIPRDRTYADDLSNFDDRVGIELWNSVIELVLEPIARALQRASILTAESVDMAIDVMKAAGTMTILVPPLESSAAGYWMQRQGGIVSGIRLTSIIGTWINWCRCEHVASKVVGREVPFFVFGDDTVFVCGDSVHATRLREESEEVSEELGFPTTPADDSAFLMRRVPEGYAYLARMMMSTMQKEDRREPRSLVVAALGIAARRSLLAGHPAAPEYERWLTSGAAGDRLQAAAGYAASTGWSIVDLGAAVMSPLSHTSGASNNSTLDDMLAALEDIEDAGGLSESDSAALNLLIGEATVATRPRVSLIEKRALEVYGSYPQSIPLLKRDLEQWRLK